jgi:hypothetical protein
MRNADGDTSFSVFGTPLKANEVTRTLLHGFSFFSLGYKPLIWMKSFVFNELNTTVNSLASSISNIGIDDVENRNQYFGAKDFLKAHTLLTTPSGFRKARRLAYLFQLIDSNERDMLESPWRVRTDRNIFQEKFAHLGNWGTDAYARMVAMAAQMIKEGSWEAYSYNAKEDETLYDEKKDRRFYDESGRELKEQGQHAIRKDLIGRLREQGIQEDEKKLTRGHDYILANNFMYLSDRFVIGSMGNLSKNLLGNHFLGQMFTQFRLFSWAKLQNAGIGMDVRSGQDKNTIAGTVFKAIKDENGEWISVREQQLIEGAWQSWGRAYAEMVRFHRMSPKEFWKSSSPQTRMNLARSVVQATMLAIVYALIKGFDDPDDEIRFNWMLSDLSTTLLVGEFFKNPFPMVSNGMKIIDAAFERDNFWSKIRRYVPFEQFYTAPVGLYKYYSEADERAEKKRKKEEKEAREKYNLTSMSDDQAQE